MTCDLSIIILSAGVPKRMKSCGPKSSIDLSKYDTVISRQIKIVKSIFPKSEIIVVVGFKKEKLLKIIPFNFKCVNNDYKTTNTTMSVKLALKKATASKILIIYGDLIFSGSIFKNMPLDQSWVAIDNQKNQRSSKVGVNIVDGQAINFSYGLTPKWGHIAMLLGKELEIYKKIIVKRASCNKFCFEIFNEIIDSSGSFIALQDNGWKLIEIDTPSDVIKAKKLNDVEAL